MATKIEQQISFNDWARKFNISTLFDYSSSDNRKFLKKLDEARSVYQSKRNKRNK
jgi:hypothetical protein